MFDINGGELVVIALLAAALLGPDRLPDLARQAAGLVRKGRDFAQGAQAQMREEIGPEFDEVDWKRYDPRQYHPRRIVQNALSDTFDDGSEPRDKAAVRSGSTAARAQGNSAAPKPKAVSPSAMTGAGSRAASASRASGRTSAPQRPSPPPATWTDAARRAGLDPDAT